MGREFYTVVKKKKKEFESELKKSNEKDYEIIFREPYLQVEYLDENIAREIANKLDLSYSYSYFGDDIESEYETPKGTIRIDEDGLSIEGSYTKEVDLEKLNNFIEKTRKVLNKNNINIDDLLYNSINIPEEYEQEYNEEIKPNLDKINSIIESCYNNDEDYDVSVVNYYGE